jgi:serine/threonine protein kinase
MGTVYEAVDERFGSRVALKQMTLHDEHLAKAFEREARLLNGLRHSALPTVTDYFSEPTGQFLVMQLIPGEDLAQKLARNGRPFALGDVLRWADQILDVLTYLHSRQPPIIHRDIKPQNLKLTPEGQIVLLDFGLAKGSVGDMTVAVRSVAGYTPYYASFEQVHGQVTEERSDIYSVGATLYNLLSARLPATASVRVDASLNGNPDPLAPLYTVNSEVPVAVSEVIANAMALQRDRRFMSAAEMQQALRAAVRPAIPSLIDAGDDVMTHVRSNAADQPSDEIETVPRQIKPRDATDVLGSGPKDSQQQLVAERFAARLRRAAEGQRGSLSASFHGRSGLTNLNAFLAPTGYRVVALPARTEAQARNGKGDGWNLIAPNGEVACHINYLREVPSIVAALMASKERE